MTHIAIMKKSWGLTEKILSGEKTIETRWYKHRVAPWGKIQAGDTVYFKDSGKPVTVVAEVASVEHIENVDEKKRLEILGHYASRDLGTTDIMSDIDEYTKGKRYCIVIRLKNSRNVEKSFEINKQGFGLMSAWLCIDDDKLKDVRC